MSDTTPVILAVVGTGITLLGVLVGLLVSLFRMLRQDLKETNARIDTMEGRLNARIESAATGLNSRIDALYQALFSHKDPAA